MSTQGMRRRSFMSLFLVWDFFQSGTAFLRIAIPLYLFAGA
jgi:hypothetical protein